MLGQCKKLYLQVPTFIGLRILDEARKTHHLHPWELLLCQIYWMKCFKNIIENKYVFIHSFSRNMMVTCLVMCDFYYYYYTLNTIICLKCSSKTLCSGCLCTTQQHALSAVVSLMRRVWLKFIALRLGKNLRSPSGEPMKNPELEDEHIQTLFLCFARALKTGFPIHTPLHNKHSTT